MDNYSLLLESHDSSTLSLTHALEEEEEEEGYVRIKEGQYLDRIQGGVNDLTSKVKEGTLLTDVSSGMSSIAQKVQLAGTRGWKSLGTYLAGGATEAPEEKASLLTQSQSQQRMGYTGIPASASEDRLDADAPERAGQRESRLNTGGGGQTNSGWESWAGDDWNDDWSKDSRDRAESGDTRGWSDDRWDREWDALEVKSKSN